jgi:two-component system chemotaxis response regulator CheY
MESKPHILVVDDSAIMRRLLRDMLDQIGTHPIAEACNGLEALEFLRNRPTCLVISDLHMQPVDGVELLHEVRADSDLAGIPFILMSGDQTPASISSAIGAGAAGILAKPFGRDQLVQQVTRNL